MPASRSSKSDSRRAAGGPWRPALLAALVVLVGVIALRFPVAPAEEWPRPHRFEPDDEACEAAREARQWTWLEVSQQEASASVADLARKLQLETGWICRANARESDCGADRLTPGETLILPLQAGAVEAARQARREGRPETTEGDGR